MALETAVTLANQISNPLQIFIEILKILMHLYNSH